MPERLTLPYPLEEKCGVFAIYGDEKAASKAYLGLYALQHRGQHSAAIVSSDGKEMTKVGGMGLIAHAIDEDKIQKTVGHLALGHTRYATFLPNRKKGGIQPTYNPGDKIAVGLNGNDPDPSKPQRFLENIGISTKGKIDTEIYQAVLNHCMQQGMSMAEAVMSARDKFTGAFVLEMAEKDRIGIFRDRFGIRPAAIGKTGAGGYVFASETCALDMVGAHFLREVRPGELVTAGAEGLRSYQIYPKEETSQRLDIFEYVYFARPDSNILGRNVGWVRTRFGQNLAKEHPRDVDIVVPVPDSAKFAAQGYAEALGIPLREAIIKNRYVHRTFIYSGQDEREQRARMKYNPIPELFQGMRVALIDDSIVRGTTNPILVEMCYAAGAKSVDSLSTSDVIRYPDYTGIDQQNQKELIGFGRTVEEMRNIIGSDYLGFLSLESMIAATDLPADMFYTGQFTGEYQIDLGSRSCEYVAMAA